MRWSDGPAQARNCSVRHRPQLRLDVRLPARDEPQQGGALGQRIGGRACLAACRNEMTGMRTGRSVGSEPRCRQPVSRSTGSLGRMIGCHARA